MNFNRLVSEWAWRVNNGMPDPKNRTHVELLRQVLIESGFDEAFVLEYTQNLLEVDDDKLIKYKQDGENKTMKAGSAKTMPKDHPAKIAWDELQDKDKNVLNLVNQSVNKVEESLSNFKFRDGCSEFMNIARIGNKYLADEEPWKIIKENPERVKTVIFISLHISSVLAIVSEPFIPFTSKKIKNILNFKDEINWTWEGLKKKDFLINENHKINEPELLFNRIEDSEIQLQIDKLHKKN